MGRFRRKGRWIGEVVSDSVFLVVWETEANAADAVIPFKDQVQALFDVATLIDLITKPLASFDREGAALKA